MTATWQQSPDLSGPRAQRTHTHMLAVARQILREGGPKALTYSSLGDRARVTRQTLYRHWPRRELLLAEIVTTGPDVGYPQPGTSARKVLTEFLTSLRDGLNDAPSVASLLAISAEAGSDPAAGKALAAISADRRAALNVLLAPAGVHVDENDFARLVGPVIYRLLHARGTATSTLITGTVDAWLLSRAAPHTARGRPASEDTADE